MSNDKIAYYHLRCLVEAAIVKIFEDPSLTRGWKLEEFLETYGTDLASRGEEETFDIAVSAPLTIQ